MSKVKITVLKTTLDKELDYIDTYLAIQKSASAPASTTPSGFPRSWSRSITGFCPCSSSRWWRMPSPTVSRTPGRTET